jgi:hypothetical protein
MCGIFGILADHHAELDIRVVRKMTDRLFLLSESRGKESAGIAVKNDDTQTISVLKRSIPASHLIKSKGYDHFFSTAIPSSSSVRPEAPSKGAFSIIAHARLVTNGTQENTHNNQPVIKNGCVLIHNGIVTNVNELWERHPELQREFEVDTEVLGALIRSGLNRGLSLERAIAEMFNEMEGAASLAVLFDDRHSAILATNTGSMYYALNREQTMLVFASERSILQRLIETPGLRSRIAMERVHWLEAQQAIRVDLPGFQLTSFDVRGLNDAKGLAAGRGRGVKFRLRDFSPQKEEAIRLSAIGKVASNSARLDRLLEFNENEIGALRRCTRCILPETFPFIKFGKDGVCNYCRNYVLKNQGGREAELREILSKHRKGKNQQDCIVAFSGGRDSSFGLHYIVNELGMKPITFTYDWGMITDLARRNCARVCGRLGIENILISADINKKRDNIRKNVAAWLQEPDLGMIPLFMAGDKHFFYYVSKLRQETGIQINIWSSNRLENTDFKSGLCGVKPSFDKQRIDYLSFNNKARLALFYLRHFLAVPAYLNASIYDTITSFYSYYAQPRHGYHQLYDFIRWDEDQIIRTLIKEYNWETSPDTSSTWRIGDGTASFYNYCYYTIAGFSEIDTFRSNQIREGMLSRENGLTLSKEENRPRYESIRWYLDTINLDFEATIKRINAAPKFYRR